MTLRLTFGIDPGLSGAIATLIDGEPGPILDMPTRNVGDWNEVAADLVSQFIREQRREHVGAYVSACVEKVGAMPTDGATSAFRFGESAGRVKAVLEVHGIPYTRAIPAVWMKQPFEVRISFAWWLTWVYLPGVMTLCMIGLHPNPERLARAIARATRVRIIPSRGLEA